MSAVVLTSLGQAVGGPFGALTGSLVGGAADLARARMAERSGGADLSGQRASYGAIIPAIYGRLRTAGTIIWAQPMRRAGGGKGGGQRSYVASFAVALSARPVARIGRIWADGREILSADGAAEFAFPLRLASAGASDPADPLIAAIEGLDQTPGYRGISLAVLEDFPLGPFGNRIPQMEFEVIADPESDSVARWLADASGPGAEPPVGQAPRPLVGWPLVAPQLRDDLAAALRASGMIAGENAGRLTIQAPGQLHLVDMGEILVREAAPGIALRRQSGIRPMAAVAYADPARDFLEGEQQVHQSGTGEPIRVATPIAMDAQVARQFAVAMLQERETAPDMMTVRLSFRFLGIAVGDRIGFSGQQQRWMVVGRTLENFEIALDCVAWNEAVNDAEGDPGRANRLPVASGQAYRIGIIELPAPGGGLASDGIIIGISADPAWRGAQVVANDGGAVRTIGFQREPARAGMLMAALPGGPEAVWDEANAIDVQLDDEQGWIESREPTAVLAGANLLWCGGELIQFRDAAPVGPGRFRLEGLLRGRMGTARAAEHHPPGTDVWFLEAGAMQTFAMGVDMAGRNVRVAALDQANGLEADHEFAGLGFAPMSPVHVRAFRLEDDGIVVRWVGRERRFLDWHAVDQEVRAAFFLVQFWWDGELRWSQRVSGEAMSLSLVEQIAVAGVRFGDFRVRVVADGAGPEAFRASAMVGL